jgi:hypothetical protein
MIITLHGRVRGNTIELVNPIDAAEGQEVEVVVKFLPHRDKLAEVYAILGERFDSRERDVAARHNEHQP